MKKKATKSPVVLCPYCGNRAELVDSSVVYKGRSYGMVWLCRPCKAWVGCHKNSKVHAPMGRLANKALRDLKRAAHEAFDPLWNGPQHSPIPECRPRFTRMEAYKWLAQKMGIHPAFCHIGRFDEEQCKQVIAIMADHKELIK